MGIGKEEIKLDLVTLGESMEPILSLVTGTLNRRESFRRLYETIASRTNVPWEMIVSDASDSPYPDQYPENVVFLPERPRVCCVHGYNMAFARARGRWVIWLNDDAEVMPGYATNSIEFMEKHSDVGLGALYYAEQVLPYQINYYNGMPYANFGIIRRELGDHLCWFDDVVKMYGNDNSLTFKVLLEGYGVVGIPNARVWHHRVMDKYKIDNQQLRNSDSRKLMAKYGQVIPHMQAVSRRFDHLQSPAILHE